jgi:Ca2+-transporting ATPase
MALIVQTPVLLLGFVSGLSEGLVAARSRLFLMLIGMELAMALNCGSLTYSLLEVKPSKWVILAVIWEAMLISILGAVPLTRNALGISSPTTGDLIWIIFAALENTLSIELLKKFAREWENRDKCSMVTSRLPK